MTVQNESGWLVGAPSRDILNSPSALEAVKVLNRHPLLFGFIV
ncbi:MAG: hypothetical protein R3219_04385 [Hydrogenovibrio sp.]|nr:hypothetical protein [Hydrogenovibrio sp.]